MPQRFLKPGIRNSERWNCISWSAQSLYIRLLTIVDDYGRFDGRSAVIHGECFSLYNAINPERPVNLQETDKMLQEIAASSLAEFYIAQGKTVMQITQWTERLREGVKEKWAARGDAELLQLPADSCKNLPSPSSSPSSSSFPPTPTPPSDFDLGSELPARFPKDEKEAKQVGSMRCIPEEFTLHVWNKAMGRGGVDSRGMPIKNFGAYLVTEHKYERDRNGKDALNGNGTHSPNGAQLVSWNQELERISVSISQLRSQYSDHQTWSQKDKLKLNEMRTRSKKLKELIGAQY